MKKLALTAAIVMFAGSALAGNVTPMAAEPVPMVMDAEPAGSGALAWIIPIVAIAAIVLASED